VPFPDAARVERTLARVLEAFNRAFSLAGLAVDGQEMRPVLVDPAAPDRVGSDPGVRSRRTFRLFPHPGGGLPARALEPVLLLLAAAALAWFYATYPVGFQRIPLAQGEIRHLGASLEAFPPTFAGLLFRNHYPPLEYLIAIPFFAILGPGEDSATALVIVLAALLPVAAYLLGREVAGTACGACAFLLTAFSTVTASHSLLFCLELPVALCASMFYWSLFRSRGLDRTGPTLLAGIFLGLGLLAKHEFVVLAALGLLSGLGRLVASFRLADLRLPSRWSLPLLLVLAAFQWVQFKDSACAMVDLVLGEALLAVWFARLWFETRQVDRGAESRRVGRILAAAVLAFAVSGPYYLGTLSGASGGMMSHPMFANYLGWSGGLDCPRSPLGMFLARAGVEDGLTPVPGWLVPISLLGAFLRPPSRWRVLGLALQFAVGFLFYWFLNLATARFLLTLLPLQAVVQGAPVRLAGPRYAWLFPLLLAGWLAVSFDSAGWATARIDKNLPDGPMIPRKVDDVLTRLRSTRRAQGKVRLPWTGAVLCRDRKRHLAVLEAVGLQEDLFQYEIEFWGCGRGRYLELGPGRLHSGDLLIAHLDTVVVLEGRPLADRLLLRDAEAAFGFRLAEKFRVSDEAAGASVVFFRVLRSH